MINHEKIKLDEEKFRWANEIWDEFNLKVEGLCMNEFTKEELLTILWAIDYVREHTTNRSDAMRGLQGKLLMIIDNYCEHK